jgi:succinoglycan biosynthesis protein ExoA
MPFISVIVPVRNEERFIQRLSTQLLTQEYDVDRFEVIVVDGESTDATVPTVRRLQAIYPNLRLLHNPKRWSSAARNLAVEAAHGELILLVDGHCELDNPGYLKDLVGAFVASGAACVGRPQPLDVPGATPMQRAIAAARASRLGHHPDSFIYSNEERMVPPESVAIAYRRSVFEKVGLFDEGFDACEDVDFNHRVARAGLSCFFTPRVKVRYHPRASLRGLFRQMTRYGRGRVRLFRKHAETFSWGSVVPALFTLGMIAGPILAWFSAWLAAAFLAGFGLYVLAVLVTSLDIVRRTRDWRIFPRLLAVFPAIHLGAGFGVLREALLGWRFTSQARGAEASWDLPATNRNSAHAPAPTQTA